MNNSPANSVTPPQISVATRPLAECELHELMRWNTPSVFNGWEQITRHDISREGINLEPVHDYMPQMGPMVGYAVTVVCEPSNPMHAKENPNLWRDYRRYLASVPGTKVVVVQDLDKPRLIGSFWGEVTARFHRALNCVGTIVDGAIRDTDEMTASGFKALARGTCVGHAYSRPIRWGIDIEVFGRTISPGQLIHADKHGFLAVPFGDEARLLEATRFMDANECRTVIAAARDTVGKSPEEICRALDEAKMAFTQAALAQFSRKGEW